MRTNRTAITRWGRWAATFIGFPLAGVVARLAAGEIDSVGAGAVGGLAGGAVLGLVQVAVGGIEPDQRRRWIAATAVGFAVGLALGSSLVGFETDTASLTAMGAVSGAAVGIAQAWSMPVRWIDRVLWAIVTPALWAAGWLVTSQVIVDADRQHALFGSSGALLVSAFAGVLHATRGRSVHPSSATALDGSMRSAVAR